MKLNINSELKKINNDLKKELQSLVSNKNSGFINGYDWHIFNSLMYYKPISKEEFQKIPSFNSSFIETHGNKLNDLFKKHTNNVEGSFPSLKRIDLETRESMEMINFRNVDISSKNDILSRSKVKLKEDLSSNYLQSEEFLNVLKNIFSQRTTLFDLEITKEEVKTLDIINENQVDILGKTKINKLYISLGTIIGTIYGEKESNKLKINAPLLFIPINLFNDNEKYKISFDSSREIKINVDVILAWNNYKKINTKINYYSFDEITSYLEYDDQAFKTLINNFYLENGLNVLDNGKSTGGLKISSNISIGLFDVYVNSTQMDMEKILRTGFVTSNILSLFSNKDSSSRLDEINNIKNEKQEKRKQELIDKGEYDVSFITKINFPQEKAIKGTNMNDNIVIQGPPGTGKTETIVSIISDSILRNKKILVSSEKIVALEVIKSRMKELAKYSIMFTNLDDSSVFYDQLNFMISESIKDKSSQANTSLIMSDNEMIFRRQEARNQIYDYMKNYQTIFQYLRTNEIGKDYSFLYKHHASHRTNEKSILRILEKSSIIEIIKQNNLLVPKLYDVLYMLNQKFSYKKSNSEFDLDKVVLSKYPFLITHTKSNLSVKKVNNTLNDLEDFSNEELFSMGGFSKTGNKILKKVFIDVKHLETYIKTKDEMRIVINLLFKKIKEVENIADSNIAEDIYNSLGSAWLHLFEEISDLYKSKGKKTDIELISSVIFDHTIQQILLLKESSNADLQKNISNGNINTFQKMISKNLSEIVEQNTTLTGRKLRDKLLDVLIESGKMSEIQFIIENQKTLNINNFMDKYWEEIFSSVNIWFLPANEVSNFFPLEPEMFDMVIIDEASQMLIEKAIPLMIRAKQLVISGDDKQLKPSVDKNERIFFDDEESSWKNTVLPPFGLQDALKNKFINFVLNYHYRSKYSELISFSNSFIYNKNLYVSTPNSYDPKKPPVEWKKVKDGKIIGGKNSAEAKEVIKTVINLINEDPDKTIGIVALTQEQRDSIMEKLKTEAEKNTKLDLFIRTNMFTNSGEDTSLFVKNVSEVQGDERDIIIFSIGFAKKSNGSYPKDLGEISIEHGENRLNVAITRAKSKIVVVSSIEPNDLIVPSSDVGGQLLKHFLYYAQAMKLGNMKNVRRILKLEEDNEVKIFESPMHEEIFKLIKDQGYDIEYKYGFDNYKIDFVIKDENKSIILGINLDNKQYLRNFNTMEREYYLPTYLEARGWSIMRIWSHQWSKDPDNENVRILERIKIEINSSNKDFVISLFEKGNRKLDFNVEDDIYIDNDGENIIDESSKLIEERYEEIKRKKRKILSEKQELEEKRWLSEYEALEAKNYSLEDDIDLILDRDFKLDSKKKNIDGIEDPELSELIRLSEKRKK